MYELHKAVFVYTANLKLTELLQHSKSAAARFINEGLSSMGDVYEHSNCDINPCIIGKIIRLELDHLVIDFTPLNGVSVWDTDLNTMGNVTIKHTVYVNYMPNSMRVGMGYGGVNEILYALPKEYKASYGNSLLIDAMGYLGDNNYNLDKVTNYDIHTINAVKMALGMEVSIADIYNAIKHSAIANMTLDRLGFLPGIEHDGMLYYVDDGDIKMYDGSASATFEPTRKKLMHHNIDTHFTELASVNLEFFWSICPMKTLTEGIWWAKANKLHPPTRLPECML